MHKSKIICSAAQRGGKIKKWSSEAFKEWQAYWGRGGGGAHGKKAAKGHTKIKGIKSDTRNANQ